MLFLKRAGTLSCLILSLNIYGASIWPGNLLESQKIKIANFTIETESFQSLFKIKKKLEAAVSLRKKVSTVSLSSNFSKSKEQQIRALIASKISLTMGDDLKKYISGYTSVGKSNGWHRYEDASGLKDKSEIMIMSAGLKVSVIEKKTIGTNYINYNFKKEKKIIFLDSVLKKSFVGLQSIKTKTYIKYQIFNDYKLPYKVSVTTEHKLITNENDAPARTLREDYMFKDYKLSK